MNDIVYVVTNPAMPGLVKIGITQKTIEQRLRELDQTGVPLPFECFYAAIVSDCRAVERALHEAFDDHRLRKSREFFRLSPEKPRAIIRLLARQEVTPGADVVDNDDDQRALDEERERRSRFDFESVGIPNGAELSSVFDDAVVCTVAGRSKVLFRGELTSLSRSALAVAHENGFRWKAVQGPAYWKYQGKTLDEHRHEEGEE
ncbi:MAG: GIY-YIG nuclease family protein [Caulobacteraceae bacterium]